MMDTKPPPLIARLILISITFLLIILIVVVVPVAALRDCYLNGLHEGIREGQSLERQKAIEANVGRWVIDEKSGVREFLYRPSRGPDAK